MSSAIIDAARTYHLCAEALKQIDAVRETRKKALVDKVVAKRRATSFISRLLREKSWTESEARSYLERDSKNVWASQEGLAYWSASKVFEDDAYRIRKLQATCALAEQVTVSSEDAASLSFFLGPERMRSVTGVYR